MKKIEELEKDLNNERLESVYFLYGEEQYLLETIVNKKNIWRMHKGYKLYFN